jgi:NAD(P)-dependent dehydrogenase (short-subunit alcohol dehydrogenase family)
MHLDGVFFAMRYEIAEMLTSGGGAIVNSGSAEGHTVLRKNAASTASKHAIAGSTDAAARDYSDKRIRINDGAPDGYHAMNERARIRVLMTF